MSEELLNSLFKVINEKSVSGSYDEKVNRLKRSGVLSDSQDFTCHQTLNKVLTGNAGNNLVEQAIGRFVTLENILSAIKHTRGEIAWGISASIFENVLTNGARTRPFFDTEIGYQEHNGAVILLREYGTKLTEQREGGYVEVVDRVLKGTGPELASIVIEASRDIPWRDLPERALLIISRYSTLGINLHRVATETSEKLANFFLDGIYNSTLIMFPTVVFPNGDAGNGTCRITSQYEVNTQGLVQKLFYHNYQSSVNNILPITSLNTLDIYSNFNFISSLGSSTTGKYIINENTCRIINYGYSVASGGFTKFKYTFIKTGIGFISTTYVLNPDNSETLRSVAYFTKV
jgi:hypothetical protein